MSEKQWFADLVEKLPKSEGGLVRTDRRLAGVDWYYSSHGGYLSGQPSDGMRLELHPIENMQVWWSWKWQIAAGVDVSHSAREGSLEAAAQAALAFKPTASEFEYLGNRLTWYSTPPNPAMGARGHWVAAIPVDEASWDGASITEYEEDTHRLGVPRFCWHRRCKAIQSVLSLTNGAELVGHVHTLEEAMSACIDAPARFIAACGALSCRIVSTGLLVEPASKPKRKLSVGGAR